MINVKWDSLNWHILVGYSNQGIFKLLDMEVLRYLGRISVIQWIMLWQNGMETKSFYVLTDSNSGVAKQHLQFFFIKHNID